MVEKIHPVSTYFKNIFKEGIDAILQCTYLSLGSVRIDTYILIDHPNQNLKLNFTLHIHISESAYYLFLQIHIVQFLYKINLFSMFRNNLLCILRCQFYFCKIVYRHRYVGIDKLLESIHGINYRILHICSNWSGLTD